MTDQGGDVPHDDQKGPAEEYVMRLLNRAILGSEAGLLAATEAPLDDLSPEQIDELYARWFRATNHVVVGLARAIDYIAEETGVSFSLGDPPA